MLSPHPRAPQGSITSRTMGAAATSSSLLTGVCLMLAYLAVDGLTSTWQDSMFSAHQMSICHQVGEGGGRGRGAACEGQAHPNPDPEVKGAFTLQLCFVGGVHKYAVVEVALVEREQSLAFAFWQQVNGCG